MSRSDQYAAAFLAYLNERQFVELAQRINALPDCSLKTALIEAWQQLDEAHARRRAAAERFGASWEALWG